jgi:hypothetical protein
MVPLPSLTKPANQAGACVHQMCRCRDRREPVRRRALLPQQQQDPRRLAHHFQAKRCQSFCCECACISCKALGVTLVSPRSTVIRFRPSPLWGHWQTFSKPIRSTLKSRNRRRYGRPSVRTYRARLRAAFIRPEMSRRRAAPSAEYRPCLNAFLSTPWSPRDRTAVEVPSVRALVGGALVMGAVIADIVADNRSRNPTVQPAEQ